MHPSHGTDGQAATDGPKRTALEAVGGSAAAGIALAGAFAALLLLTVLGCWYTWRRRTGAGRKRVDDRPITLRRPTAVRNPTSHSHYLKKSPSPTGCKSPPGGTEKSPNGAGSPNAPGDLGGKGSSLGGQRGGGGHVGLGVQRATTPKLLSPTDEKRLGHDPLSPQPPTLASPLDPDKALLNSGGDNVYFENEKTGSGGNKPLSPMTEESELNCKNIKRNDSVERLGKLYFKLRYKSDTGALIVTIVKCTDLPRAEGGGGSQTSSSDPYVKLQLLPDKHHKAKTRVLRNTLNPVYDEDFTFYGISVTHLKDLTLHFVVLSFDRYSRDDIIGEVVTPLATLDLGEPLALARPINPRSLKIRSQGRGELLLSLCHQPAATRLTVVVLKARNLPKMDITGLSDPYVKIYLLYNGQRVAKKKTHVKKRTVNPVFNESFVFDLPAGAEDLSNVSLEFMLLDWDRVTKNEVIGRLELGGPRCVGSAKHHWAEVVNSPRRQIAEWHKLREAPK